MKTVMAFIVAVFALACLSASSTMAEAVKPQVAEGSIQSVDLKAKTFVLGGKNETQTTFKVATQSEGNREAAKVLLDGKKASFEAAVQAGRKVSVTYVKVADTDLWVWSVAVTSAAKEPDRAR